MRRLIRLSALILAISACIIAGLGNTSYVHAANGLTVSPPLREITLGPGLIETTADITIQNNTSQVAKAHLQLVDLKALSIYGGTSLDKAGLTDKYDLANWMTLPDGDTVSIASGQTVKVRVVINNRSDLSPGGHYGAIVITPTDDGGVKSNVNISQQVVSLLFIKKLGGEVYGLQLEPFSYKNQTIPDQITTHFKSTGNVHVVPRGFIEVTDPTGKVVSKGILNPDSNIILPGSSREFVTLMQSVSSSSKPGRYKITVHYRYDGSNDFQEQSVYFTRGLPLAYILAAGAAILTLCGVAVYLFLNRRSTRRA